MTAALSSSQAAKKTGEKGESGEGNLDKREHNERRAAPRNMWTVLGDAQISLMWSDLVVIQF